MKQDDDKISDLYRQSASEQPPSHVDEAILAASRKAVSAKPSVAPFSGRWQLPVSLAAVVVVAVLLVPLLQQESRDTEVPVPSAVAPLDTAVSAPPALMRQKVAEPKKEKAARLRKDVAPAREESEKLEAVLEEDALSTGYARSAAVAEAPDQWLKRIEALIEKKNEQEAVAELREFIRQYPEYPLTPALQALRDKNK